MKKILCVTLALFAVLSLCSCNLIANIINEGYAQKLVKGNLDSLYLGKIEDEYVELVGSTKEEIEKDYNDSMEYEAEYFAYYWGIIEEGENYEALSEELRANIVDLYKEIYSHSKYEVKGATRQDDGSFAVQVTIEPMDIMIRASELYDSGDCAQLDAFLDRVASVNWETITESEYWDLMNEYGQIIVDMVESLIPTIGYEEQKSMVIQVLDHGDYVQMSEDDLSVFDSYILLYE